MLIGGKYVVERQLAQGGIGVVVVATHRQLKQKVAIKYLLPETLKQPALVERFKREAQLAASIASEHVVRVFDIGTTDGGSPYMVMEYLQGEDLGAVLRRGPIPPATAIDYLMQACDAIAEAHALGIVHRDLKPANLFLSKGKRGETTLKILDFGISKASANLPPMTQVTEQFGTLDYMSPEQLRSSANVDSLADLWALGVVLFELLTGTLPFSGQTIGHVAEAIEFGTPRRLADLCPDIHPEIESAILTCLEKNPRNRFRDVAKLAQVLARHGTSISEQCLVDIQSLVEGSGRARTPGVIATNDPRIAEMFHRPLSAPPPPIAAMQRDLARWKQAAIASTLTAILSSTALLAAATGFVPVARGGTSSQLRARETVPEVDRAPMPPAPIPENLGVEPADMREGGPRDFETGGTLDAGLPDARNNAAPVRGVGATAAHDASAPRH